MLLALVTLLHALSNIHPATLLLTTIGGATIVVGGLTHFANKLPGLFSAIGRARVSWNENIASNVRLGKRGTGPTNAQGIPA